MGQERRQRGSAGKFSEAVNVQAGRRTDDPGYQHQRQVQVSPENSETSQSLSEAVYRCICSAVLDAVIWR
ncbi:uncharacterized protein FOMMEDRAFT_150000 [Fomitiporia mediterranea MF3/22]|uniref:uncharacterized protein n=1 Tax=Fomitiporia mediterranea (strain MF3/22) TaxID=694068 RepID=UPI000440879E|nr:uncharacterized protein FOMMEDRAFT_150000 [Fomitiporia mediterranea MF3/22]EJD07468.1 hypothetical protein FOMMEDRAFT_150000 [Fomitiporia mediterranea MF3/22]